MKDKHEEERERERPGRKPGIRPDVRGVPGEIVAGSSVHTQESTGKLVWGRRIGRVSPYDEMLDRLISLTAEVILKGEPKPALRFTDRRAYSAVERRARKRGLRLSFGTRVATNELWVRFEGNTAESVRVARRKAILGYLKSYGAASEIKIASSLREAGDSDMDAQLVRTVLVQLQRDGDVVSREGGTWGLNPVARKAG